jgi:hypothetical protein
MDVDSYFTVIQLRFKLRLPVHIVDLVTNGRVDQHACTMTSAKFLGKPATCPWPQANRFFHLPSPVLPIISLGQVLIMCTTGKRDRT